MLSIKEFWHITLIGFLCLIFLPAWGVDSDIVYLTWLRDPTTTMTIQWHTGLSKNSSQLHYTEGESNQWMQSTGTHQLLASSSILVHTVELTSLTPDTLYHFRLEEKTYCFRTLPATLNSRPVRFVTAGDAFLYLSPFKKMNQKIAQTNPDFILVGGDIAYTHGVKSIFDNKQWQIKRWQTFLREWTHQMVTSDGRLIPLLAILGNHDIKTSYNDPQCRQKHFFQLFAMPEESLAYRAYIIGNYLSLILLDSGHRSPIHGEQTEWLRKTLKEHYALPYRLAAYHIAAFPSVYKATGNTPSLIRKYWLPHFERTHLQVAFEHHNHAFKRTHPIKNGRMNPSGVLYLGDGCWGVKPRAPRKPSQVDYLADARKVNHFWLTTLTPNQMLLQAFDMKGHIIDQISY